jgi:hypothetical protein
MCIFKPFEWLGMAIMLLFLSIAMPIFLLHDKVKKRNEKRKKGTANS